MDTFWHIDFVLGRQQRGEGRQRRVIGRKSKGKKRKRKEKKSNHDLLACFGCVFACGAQQIRCCRSLCQEDGSPSRGLSLCRARRFCCLRTAHAGSAEAPTTRRQAIPAFFLDVPEPVQFNPKWTVPERDAKGWAG